VIAASSGRVQSPKESYDARPTGHPRGDCSRRRDGRNARHLNVSSRTGGSEPRDLRVRSRALPAPERNPVNAILKHCAARGCSTLVPAGTARCGLHARPGRGQAHRLARAQTLAEEQVCWLCGQPARPTDPLTADHVVPRANGGPDARWNYRAAHLSCNRRRGANGGDIMLRTQGLVTPADSFLRKLSANGDCDD